MRYKGTDKSLPEIARELKVDAVVEGSVLQAGERVRITAELIDAATDQHLWAESYERDLRDILSLQSEVAKAIAQEIKIKLTPQEQSFLQRSPAVDAGAYEAYLKGRHHWNKRTADAVKKGIGYFEQAIAKDPGYPLAHVGLAESYNILGFYGLLLPKETFPRAKAAALKALEIDETLSEAHAALAYGRFYYDWSWAESEEGFKRAIQLNPSDAIAHQFYGNYLPAMGRFEEAIAEFERAQQLDPLSLILNSALGWGGFHLARQYDRAIEQLERTLELDPNFAVAHHWLGLALEQERRYEEATAEFEKANSLWGGSPRALASLGHVYAMAGKTSEALKTLDELEELSKRRYVGAYHIAVVHIGLGDKDRAFEWLEKAYDERFPALAFLKVEPIFDPLRDDPRFQDLVRRMNFPD